MRELLLEKETVLAKNLIEPHLDDYAVLVSVQYSYVNSGAQAGLIADAKRMVTTFGNVPQKIKSIIASLINFGSYDEKSLQKIEHGRYMPLLGYACSGKVIAVGKRVASLKTGDYVACVAKGSIQYQDIVCVPLSQVVPLKSPEFLKKGSIVPLGAAALRSVRIARLQLGEYVCVLGLGVTGQLIAQLAQQSGCTVVGIDPLQERVAVASSWGLQHVYSMHDEALKNLVGLVTHDNGFDVTFIAMTNPTQSSFNTAAELTRHQGRIIAWSDSTVSLSHESLANKELQLLLINGIEAEVCDVKNSCNDMDRYGAENEWSIQKNMQTILHKIEQNTLIVDPFITYEESILNIEKAHFELKNKKQFGVMLKYAEKIDAQFVPAVVDYSSEVIPVFKRVEKDRVGVGIVGASGIEENNFLPALSKISSVHINAVSDYTLTQAQTIARKIGTTKTFSHEDKLYKDKDVDAVIIASSDRLHASQALAALSAGKAVFMKRPMVTTFEEYELFNTYLKRSADIPLCVDYGRSFSSLIQKIKWETVGRTSPLMIRYSVVTDFMRAQNLIQKGHSAGSVIDEASAIFELFCFLTDLYPVAVSVEALRSFSKQCFPTDNFTVQISFSDGSVCSLFYTSLAHPQTPQEQMEVFFDGKTIVMTDYKILRGYGVSRNFDTELQTPDKGSPDLLHKFFNALQQEEIRMPFTKERLAAIAHLTLTVDKLVCQGGGVENLL